MKVLSISLFALGILIYGFRVYDLHQKSPETLFVVKQEGSETINSKIFEQVLTVPHREILGNQMFTLLIFLDPDRLCPVLLDEVTTWTGPWEKVGTDVYNVHFFIAEDKIGDEFYAFLYKNGMDESNVTLFDPEGRERNFTQFGVFKIFYSQESGLLFFDFGNDSPDEFKTLKAKITNAINPS
jgi:uncharacterized protein YrzB (UPF0473 family)